MNYCEYCGGVDRKDSKTGPLEMMAWLGDISTVTQTLLQIGAAIVPQPRTTDI